MNTPYFDIVADKEPPKSCTSYDVIKVFRHNRKRKFDKGLYTIILIFLVNTTETIPLVFRIEKGVPRSICFRTLVI